MNNVNKMLTQKLPELDPQFTVLDTGLQLKP